MMESFLRLNQAERLVKKFPGLDCGSCGAPTCKALAEDIVRGEASETDCVYYLRENLHRLSEEVAILADDLHSKDKSSQDTLNTLKSAYGGFRMRCLLWTAGKRGRKNDRTGTD